MKRLLFLLAVLMMVGSSFAVDVKVDTVVLRKFLLSSVNADDYMRFGFNSLSEPKKATFGQPIPLYDLTTDVLTNYPNYPLTKTSKCSYVPVIMREKTVCFLVIDVNGNPRALGYSNFAEKLNKIKAIFNVSNIVIYQSFNPHGYLFSIPNRKPNLTQLSFDWKVSRIALTPESTTIEFLKKCLENAK